MKTLYKILALAVLDFGLIWLWVYQMNPDPSLSIGIILLVPFVFTLNLFMAGVLFLAKNKEYAKIFLINAVVSSVIMAYLFQNGIERHRNNRIEKWTFEKADTTFFLVLNGSTKKFSIKYSINPPSHSPNADAALEMVSGSCEPKKEQWILSAEPLRMKVERSQLIGFRNPADSVQLRVDFD